MKKLTKKEQDVIKQLDETGSGDPEIAHGAADELVLSVVHPGVKEAYERLVKRCGWWARA